MHSLSARVPAANHQSIDLLHAEARNNLARQVGWEAPQSKKRCDVIKKVQQQRDAGKTRAELKDQYKTVSQDVNTFYRTPPTSSGKTSCEAAGVCTI